MATISEVYQGQAESNVFYKDAVIASGASSVDVVINGYKLAGIAFPTGMANTKYTFSLSIDDEFYPVFSNDDLELGVAVTTGATRYAYLTPSDSASLQGTIRIKGTATETANRTLKLVLRPY